MVEPKNIYQVTATLGNVGMCVRLMHLDSDFNYRSLTPFYQEPLEFMVDIDTGDIFRWNENNCLIYTVTSYQTEQSVSCRNR